MHKQAQPLFRTTIGILTVAVAAYGWTGCATQMEGMRTGKSRTAKTARRSSRGVVAIARDGKIALNREQVTKILEIRMWILDLRILGVISQDSRYA